MFITYHTLCVLMQHVFVMCIKKIVVVDEWPNVCVPQPDELNEFLTTGYKQTHSTASRPSKTTTPPMWIWLKNEFDTPNLGLSLRSGGGTKGGGDARWVVHLHKQNSLRKHVPHLWPSPPLKVSILVPTPTLRHVSCFAVSFKVVNRVVQHQKCCGRKVTREWKENIKCALRTIESGYIQELAHSRQVVMVSFLICSALPSFRKAG